MTKEVFSLKSSYDGLDICTALLIPEGQPKAILQFAHGMCGNKERFYPTMEHFTSKGFLCIANDHRGHGDSIRQPADLGYMYEGGSEALVDDMRMVSEYVCRRYPELPLVLIGHSMGSLAARVFAKRHDNLLSGLIICGSPSYNPMSGFGLGITYMLPRRTRMTLVQKASSASFNRRFRKEGVQAWTCSDPEVREAFMKNPKCNFTFTANASRALMEMMREAYDVRDWRPDRPDMPVLFLSGGDDPCMSGLRKHEAAVEMMKKAGYADVKSVIYPGMRHEILNEKEKEKVWKDIESFLSGLSEQGNSL